jgi:hypothetical protein
MLLPHPGYLGFQVAYPPPEPAHIRQHARIWSADVSEQRLRSDGHTGHGVLRPAVCSRHQFTPRSCALIAYLMETMRGAAPLIVGTGVATAEEIGMETLEQRLRDETQRTQAVSATPSAAPPKACRRKPAAAGARPPPRSPPPPCRHKRRPPSTGTVSTGTRQHHGPRHGEQNKLPGPPQRSQPAYGTASARHAQPHQQNDRPSCDDHRSPNVNKAPTKT